MKYILIAVFLLAGCETHKEKNDWVDMVRHQCELSCGDNGVKEWYSLYDSITCKCQPVLCCGEEND